MGISVRQSPSPHADIAKPGSGGITHVYNGVSQTVPLSGNETIPRDTILVIIEAWGGGGDGGNSSIGQPGGGGGGYCKKTLSILSSDWGASIPFVASGGSPSGTGTSGGNSTIGSVTLNSGAINMSAGGGDGGTDIGAGGTASGGDLNLTGGAGTASKGGDSPYGGLGAVVANPPGGGSSPGIGQDTEGGATGRVKFTWS